MKRYLIFAGVNGAGKTTLYQTHSEYKNLPRVNMDEIVRSFGSWKDRSDVMKAGKIAVGRIREYFEQGMSFNQETTLCGHSIFRNIKRAKNLGYEVELYYVGLSSAELAQIRVEQRVRDGGHGVPAEDIKRRYGESLENLRKISPLCDRVIIYDNTTAFKRIASLVRGEIKDCVEEVPEWCADILRYSL